MSFRFLMMKRLENVAGSDFDKDAEALETHEEESEKEAAEQEAALPWNE